MKYLNALNTIKGLGAMKMKLLIGYFPTPRDAWNATRNQLLEAGINEALATKIISERVNIDPETEWKKLESEDIIAISQNDHRYPKLLREIPDNPALIYMKGDLDCLNLPMIAIVGSRALTNYGLQVTHGFSRDLAGSGICVVSGLAFGVDACAHRGALEAKGRTIAVLGNSLDDASIAPRTNFELSRDILRNGGLLISEFPIKTSASIGTFPARNRIMAGISLSTVVVEAKEKSGSLITANLAVDYNRDVFAVPGSIFSAQSNGTNLLIQKGAKLVTCVNDILSELRLDKVPTRLNSEMKISLNEEEKTVYRVLSHESTHIDRIAKLTKLDTSTISSTLAILEIKALVKNIGGQNYIRL